MIILVMIQLSFGLLRESKELDDAARLYCQIQEAGAPIRRKKTLPPPMVQFRQRKKVTTDIPCERTP
ncbi:hypothetical protein EUGRSUZ_G03174 [Eucalyptus grandis]|uniref:Uncharacterized protein n=2 Tax=Eucalyptus grandis TaxID=71139 RepID=A0ACC3K8U5_EUCGR|nr:hypothetical protein EUGRSUZ_G03174 [Eucalyptus grandis]